MITQKEFKYRVFLNSQEYVNQIKNNQFDLLKYHGFDAKAGTLGRFVLAKKTHDILGAVVLGFLPHLKENTGADAVKLDNGYKHVEIKTSYVSLTPGTVFKTVRDTIYLTENINQWQDGIPHSLVSSLKSRFNASYTIKNNMESKIRDTYLVTVDSNSDAIIDCYMMPAKTIKAVFSIRDIPDSKNMTIKLAQFMNKGEQAYAIVPTIGFDNWYKTLLPDLPLRKTYT